VLLWASATFPPAPDNRLPPRDALDASKVALLAGRPEQAYRLLLIAQPAFGADPEWFEAAARVYLALDRPGLEAQAFLALAPGNPLAAARANALLERTGNGPRLSFQPLGRWPGMDKKSIRPVIAVAPGPAAGAYLLTEDALLTLAPDGRILKSDSVLDAKDLTLDASGSPIVLGADSVRWGDAVIRLPATVTKPVSVAPAPDGSFFVLTRGDQRLYRISRKGASLGSAAVALGDPIKVRVDLAGRIYLADRDNGQVRLYGADMTPVRTVTLAQAGRPLRRLEDLTVDAGGNLLVVDGSSKEALLYSAAGQFLASTGQALRADGAGWDGLGNLLVLDRREGVLWRYGS
jgi:sugar lactone lactonase YvrE